MVSSAGAMFTGTPDHPQSMSRSSSRRANTTSDSEGTLKRPKKVNSEIRKQQNRIASRNYREKRKRKLQYLQQLLQDGESPEQAAQAVEEREWMITPEYQTERQQQNPQPIYTLPPRGNFQPVTVTSGNAIGSISSPAIAYDRQLDHTRHSYNNYANTWNTPMYDPSSNINLSGWSIPNWMPNVEFASTEASRPDEFHYTSSQTHNAFEQLSTPPQQPRTPDSDLFLLGSYGHCRRADSHQPMGIANVSLSSSASSSPYHYTRYAGIP